jgi:hypothetical protein
MSECKADAGCPSLLIKQEVGPPEQDQFRTKKEKWRSPCAQRPSTRTLAGILADIGSYPDGRSFGAATRPRPLRKMSGLCAVPVFRILDEFLQFSAGFEKRDPFGGNFDCCASFGIASCARSSFARVEATEPTEFDFITAA